MNTEAQRIAIAEACGFTPFLNCHNQPFDPPRWLSPARDMTFGTLPDYLNSLDAMHEAEKFIPSKKWIPYMNALRRVTETPDNGTEWDSEARNKMQWLCASAAQRAEAFLRTIGKWSENPT